MMVMIELMKMTDLMKMTMNRTDNMRDDVNEVNEITAETGLTDLNSAAGVMTGAFDENANITIGRGAGSDCNKRDFGFAAGVAGCDDNEVTDDWSEVPDDDGDGDSDDEPEDGAYMNRNVGLGDFSINRESILTGGDLTVASVNPANLTTTGRRTALELTERSGLALEASEAHSASSDRSLVLVAPEPIPAPLAGLCSDCPADGSIVIPVDPIIHQTHSFSRDLAKEFGNTEALLLGYIGYKIGRSRQRHDNRNWFFESLDELAARYRRCRIWSASSRRCTHRRERGGRVHPAWIPCPCPIE